MAVLLGTVLWILRIFRALVIIRCLLSCFVERDNRVYRFLDKATIPIVFPITFITSKAFKKRFSGFDWCALFAYIVLLFITAAVMGAKVSQLY